MTTEVTYLSIPTDVVKELIESWEDIKPETLTGPVIKIDTILRKYKKEIDADVKSCPFCGGKAKAVVVGYYPDEPEAYVFCTKCGIRTASFESTSTSRVREIWNRRVDENGMPH